MKKKQPNDEISTKFLTIEIWRNILLLLYREDIGRTRRVCKIWLSFITGLNAENGNQLLLNDEKNPNFLQQFSPSRPNYLICDPRCYKPYYYYSPFDELFKLARDVHGYWLNAQPQSLPLRDLDTIVNDKNFQIALMHAMSAIEHENADNPNNKLVSIDRLVSLISKERNKIWIGSLATMAEGLKHFEYVYRPALRELDQNAINPKLLIAMLPLLSTLLSILYPKTVLPLVLSLIASFALLLLVSGSVLAVQPIFKIISSDLASLDLIENERCKQIPALLAKCIPIALHFYFERQSFSELVSMLINQNRSTDMRCLAAYSLAIRYHDNENDKRSKDKLDQWMKIITMTQVFYNVRLIPFFKESF